MNEVSMGILRRNDRVARSRAPEDCQRRTGCSGINGSPSTCPYPDGRPRDVYVTLEDEKTRHIQIRATSEKVSFEVDVKMPAGYEKLKARHDSHSDARRSR